MQRFVPIAHIVAVVFAIIELGLTAYLVSPDGWTPSVFGFMHFSSIWSLVVLAYIGLTPLYFARVFHRLAALGLEWITMIFWFAGSIALAARWGSPRCDGNTYCGSVGAAIAFGFFLWATFAFLVFVDTLEALRSRGHHTSTAHPKPPMAV
ncbi:hypothetical protein N656DRAFT_718327 [Canariomyces notabilis]|uniref:MARVEL domain-containing protein n=1 Tax=Canariomyces notabilis TaxID=2074819 RepID=A0AAN6T8U7_9PEZI|nr:hypothetical protein N656DRAFT_718327 [Canariomyces arenarius]